MQALELLFLPLLLLIGLATACGSATGLMFAGTATGLSTSKASNGERSNSPSSILASVQFVVFVLWFVFCSLDLGLAA